MRYGVIVKLKKEIAKEYVLNISEDIKHIYEHLEETLKRKYGKKLKWLYFIKKHNKEVKKEIVNYQFLEYAKKLNLDG